MDLALTRKGHEIVGACEIDRYARQVYAEHFPGVPIFHDATKLTGEEFGDIDGICAGFPCQTFSVAGNRLGFEESRGTLFFEIARLAKQKRPRLLLLENVTGLLYHDSGRTFAVILATLDELGYDAQWQVLDSQYHRTAQHRERVFIIGHLRDTPRPKVFPIPTSITESNEKYVPELCRNGITTLLKVSYPESRRRSLLDSYTLRHLTPLEYERLQQFPDGWTCNVSEGQRYKQTGNAVTVPVIEFILERLT